MSTALSNLYFTSSSSVISSSKSQVVLSSSLTFEQWLCRKHSTKTGYQKQQHQYFQKNHITALSPAKFKPYIKKVFHPAIGRKTVFRVTTKIPINLWAAQPL